jgi:hypothetical protein
LDNNENFGVFKGLGGFKKGDTIRFELDLNDRPSLFITYSKKTKGSNEFGESLTAICFFPSDLDLFPAVSGFADFRVEDSIVVKISVRLFKFFLI